MILSRRNFMQGGILIGAGLSVDGVLQSQRPLPSLPPTADVSGLTPPIAALNSQTLALGKIFPTLTDPDAAEGPRIVNTLSGNDISPGHMRRGEIGNSAFQAHAGARAIIPWAPLFVRGNALRSLPASVTRQIDCSDLLVMNESSAHHPIFGNKARKYEFLLPNLKWSGVQRLATLGAVSSNHALQFALANRMAALTAEGQPLNCDLDLVLFEVPGAATDKARLAILRSLVERLVLAEDNVELAGEAAFEYAKPLLHPDTDSIVPPGGSNELSVLGHINAIAELSQLLDAAQAWKTPPDVISSPWGAVRRYWACSWAFICCAGTPRWSGWPTRTSLI